MDILLVVLPLEAEAAEGVAHLLVLKLGEGVHQVGHGRELLAW